MINHHLIETRQVNGLVGGVTVVLLAFRKIPDRAAQIAMWEELNSLLEIAGGKHVLLNFERVEYVSSLALSKLIDLHKKISGAGGRLMISNLSKDVEEVFKITRLHLLLDIQKKPGDGDGFVGVRKLTTIR